MVTSPRTLLGFAFVGGLTSYYAVGVLLGIAGPGAMVSCFVLVGRTFRASQGTATGMVLLGTAIGGVVMPVVTVELIQAFGWRTGMAALYPTLPSNKWCRTLARHFADAERSADERTSS